MEACAADHHHAGSGQCTVPRGLLGRGPVWAFVATSATVVQLYGPTNWDTLNQKIKDILIDMTYRGDYTPYARTLIQKYEVNNDLADFTAAMSIRVNWPEVPLARFNGRVAYLRS